MMPPRYHDEPETEAQATTWEVVKNHALRYGLCVGCASQLAWGHQLGFGRLEHSPCSVCAPLVARLPKSRPMGWRTVVGSADHASSWAAAVERAENGLAAVGGTPVPGNAAARLNARPLPRSDANEIVPVGVPEYGKLPDTLGDPESEASDG